jgi:hypothetical protein
MRHEYVKSPRDIREDQVVGKVSEPVFAIAGEIHAHWRAFELKRLAGLLLFTF